MGNRRSGECPSGVVSGWRLESRNIETDRRPVTRDTARVVADPEIRHASRPRKTGRRQISTQKLLVQTNNVIVIPIFVTAEHHLHDRESIVYGHPLAI